jgi:hypothetical protein
MEAKRHTKKSDEADPTNFLWKKIEIFQDFFLNSRFPAGNNLIWDQTKLEKILRQMAENFRFFRFFNPLIYIFDSPNWASNILFFILKFVQESLNNVIKMNSLKFKFFINKNLRVRFVLKTPNEKYQNEKSDLLRFVWFQL